MFRDNTKVMMFNNGKDKEKEMMMKKIKEKDLKNFWIYTGAGQANMSRELESSKPTEKGFRLGVEYNGKKYVVESTANYEVLTKDGWKALADIKKGDVVKFFTLQGEKDATVATFGKKEFKGEAEMFDVDTEFRIVNHLYYKAI